MCRFSVTIVAPPRLQTSSRITRSRAICRVHRDRIAQVFATLAYFDGLNFAARATSKALFSVGLMDEICPPSTVYAAFNHYGGPKRIQAWLYNGHDGGGPHQDAERIRFLHEIWG